MKKNASWNDRYNGGLTACVLGDWGRYLLLVQRTIMEALQQIHEASHQHALLAATESGQGGRQALLLTPDDPLHGMYAMPEAWHACEALGQLIEVSMVSIWSSFSAIQLQKRASLPEPLGGAEQSR